MTQHLAGIVIGGIIDVYALGPGTAKSWIFEIPLSIPAWLAGSVIGQIIAWMSGIRRR